MGSASMEEVYQELEKALGRLTVLPDELELQALWGVRKREEIREEKLRGFLEEFPTFPVELEETEVRSARDFAVSCANKLIWYLLNWAAAEKSCPDSPGLGSVNLTSLVADARRLLDLLKPIEEEHLPSKQGLISKVCKDVQVQLWQFYFIAAYACRDQRQLGPDHAFVQQILGRIDAWKASFELASMQLARQNAGGNLKAALKVLATKFDSWSGAIERGLRRHALPIGYVPQDQGAPQDRDPHPYHEIAAIKCLLIQGPIHIMDSHLGAYPPIPLNDFEASVLNLNRKRCFNGSLDELAKTASKTLDDGPRLSQRMEQASSELKAALSEILQLLPRSLPSVSEISSPGSWSLVSPTPGDQALAAELAERLVEVESVASWRSMDSQISYLSGHGGPHCFMPEYLFKVPQAAGDVTSTALVPAKDLQRDTRILSADGAPIKVMKVEVEKTSKLVELEIDDAVPFVTTPSHRIMIPSDGDDLTIKAMDVKLGSWVMCSDHMAKKVVGKREFLVNDQKVLAITFNPDKAVPCYPPRDDPVPLTKGRTPKPPRRAGMNRRGVNEVISIPDTEAEYQD